MHRSSQVLNQTQKYFADWFGWKDGVEKKKKI